MPLFLPVHFFLCLQCWGDNLYGQAGISGGEDVGLFASDMGDALPNIELGTNLLASGLASGSAHNCAIVNGGDVKVCGVM